jgi:tetratricopeptide (TPR) repeat protein
MAEWRLREGAYLEAIALCSRSLLSESSDPTRAVLASAEAGAARQHISVPQDVSSIDPTASPVDSALKSAKLAPAEVREGLLREKRLRHTLSAVYNDWGAAEAHQDQFLAAMVHFQEAERWDASTPGLMRNLGLAASKVGDNREAVRALKLAVKGDPKDNVSRSLLAVSLFALGDYAEAAKSFDRFGDAALADPEMAYAWAFSLSRTSQFQRARIILDKLSDQSLTAEMLILVGKVYNDVGDYTHALTCFQKASRQDATARSAHGGAGVALIHLDRPADAVPELEAELKLNPADPDSQYQLAYALLQLSKTDEATPILRTLVAAHPDHARARYQLGKILLDSKQTDEAIQNLEAAAKLDPERAYVHYQLQAAYRQAGRPADAERELKLYKEMKDRDRERISEQHNQSQDSSN